MTSEEEKDIQRGQRLLLQSRQRGGLSLNAGAGPLLPPGRLDRHSAPMPIGEAFKGPLVVKGSYICTATFGGVRCKNVVTLPGICTSCAERSEKEKEKARQNALLDLIPAEYRTSAWDALEMGVASRGNGKRVRAELERIRSIRKTLTTLPEGGRVVIVGPAGEGKSTLAAAWLIGEIRRGVPRAWWVCADQLEDNFVVDEGGPPPRDMAIKGDSVVIDDLGAELAGANERSGMLAVRLEAASKVIPARARRNAGRLVITTPHDEKAMRKFYGDGIKRRVYEGAVVIPMGIAL